MHLLDFRLPELVRASTLTLGLLVVLAYLVLMLVDRWWLKLWQLSLIQLALGLSLFDQQVGFRYLYQSGTCAQSGLCRVATALAVYRVDVGAYPTTLADLVPRYIKVIPNCPSARRDTYSVSYHARGDEFTLHCSGSHHTPEGLRPGHPAYSSRVGLVLW